MNFHTLFELTLAVQRQIITELTKLKTSNYFYKKKLKVDSEDTKYI